jgi:hypothetical protein
MLIGEVNGAGDIREQMDLVGPPRVIKCEFERALQRVGTAAKVCFLEQISFFFFPSNQ